MARRAEGAPADRAARRRVSSRRVSREANFYLYVEGARDRDILRVWARRLAPRLARVLDPCAVILGGRRPARAIEHFRGLGGSEAGLRGLVVLDRDHHDREGEHLGEPGLELYTWGRRHIESYLLVPEAIRRFLERTIEPPVVDRLVEQLVPPGADEDAHRSFDAKRLFGSKGPIYRDFGETLSAGEVARCMRAEDLHPDVIALFDRIRHGLGIEDSDFQVVRRSPPI